MSAKNEHERDNCVEPDRQDRDPTVRANCRPATESIRLDGPIHISEFLRQFVEFKGAEQR
jgi:hypothetical protein